MALGFFELAYVDDIVLPARHRFTGLPLDQSRFNRVIDCAGLERLPKQRLHVLFDALADADTFFSAVDAAQFFQLRVLLTPQGIFM